MPDFTLTEEQEACIYAAAKTKDSLIWEALAGAAKTSTLVLAAQKLELVPTLSVSFNKKIADEMAKRMPGHISASTMNSLGHRVWGQTRGGRLTVDSGKMYGIVKDIIDKHYPRGAAKDELMENLASLLRVVRRAKAAGWVPDSLRDVGRSLVDFDEFMDSLVSELDVEPSDEFCHVVTLAIETSCAQAFSNLIDFDDQIYMPTLFGGKFPKFPIILVDEAQDLSPLNHEMLEKLFGGRMIAVGDPYQSIYGFRGADHNSMTNLAERFNLKPMRLSTSFRCPKAVVERAQRRVPHMRYPAWAKEGKVERLPHWDSETVPEGAAIICRNNAPLFQVALRLIRSGRNVKMKTDIGPALIKLLKKLGPDTMPRDAVEAAIRAWREAEIAKARESRHAVINDRAECLLVFAEQGETLGAAIAFAEHLFSATGKIELMTGHGAKGLEYEVVFHLDPWRVPSKHAKRAADAGDFAQMEQELNLRYVIETRAKDTMYLVNLDDFQ